MNPRETLKLLNQKARSGELDVVKFLEEHFILESGAPIRFEPWQVEHVLNPVLRRREHGWDTFLISVPKKNGKSTLAGGIAVYALMLDDLVPEVYGTAGDVDQAGIIFRNTWRAIDRSAGLRPFFRLYKDVIERVDGNGLYRVLAADASSAHGFNGSAIFWDELWNQPSWDLWEALTHSPAREAPFHFVVTYAGYQARSGNLLWDLYSRGLSGEDPRPYTFWREGPDANLASWVTPAYLESQRRRLPEHIYRRLHENSWSVAEGTKVFRIPPDCWRGEFEEPMSGARYSAGIDLAKSRDYTAWAIQRTDTRPMRIVDFGKLPHIDYTQQVELLAAKLERFGNPKTLVDKGAAGEAVLELMRRRGLNAEEFSFTSESKANIVTSLAVAFEQRNILLPGTGRTLDESRAIQDLEAELFNFEPTVLRSGNVRYEAAGGYHDDLVMALCLSNEASRRQTEDVPRGFNVHTQAGRTWTYHGSGRPIVM